MLCRNRVEICGPLRSLALGFWPQIDRPRLYHPAEGRRAFGGTDIGLDSRGFPISHETELVRDSWKVRFAQHAAHASTPEQPRPFARNLQRLPVCAQRSEEHTSELQSLMRHSYAVFCLKKKNQ